MGVPDHPPLPASAISVFCKIRWQVELFSKRVKHLRIQHFYGTSGNAVKAQIWIAVSAYASAVHPEISGIALNLNRVMVPKLKFD